MSRSIRKTKIFGNANCASEKMDKRKANRVHRREVKESVNAGKQVIPEKRESSEVWSFGKDGKGYWADAPVKEMRK